MMARRKLRYNICNSKKISNFQKNFTNHRVRSFHCLNNNYVFSSWFCDGINDCGDASDESYGCDQVKFKLNKFLINIVVWIYVYVMIVKRFLISGSKEDLM